MQETKRNHNCFDFLRLLAAFAVVEQHAVAHLNVPFLWFYPGDNNWFFDGVTLFFILSGFLVYRSCEKCVENKHSIWKFYFNRVLRIVPAIYFYLIATIFLMLFFGFIHFKVQLLEWVGSTLLLIPVYSPSMFKGFGVGVINGSLWTIPAEFGFYIITPLLLLFSKRIGFKWMILSLLVIGTLSYGLSVGFDQRGIDTIVTKLFKVSFVPYLFFFGLGIFWSKMWAKSPKSYIIALICSITYILLRYDIIFSSKVFGSVSGIITSIPLSYVVIWFGYNAPKIFSKITKVGDLSYGVYIWHMVVINTFIYLNVSISIHLSIVVHLLLIAITFTIAMISWWIIEKPFLKLKPFTSNKQDNNMKILYFIAYLFHRFFRFLCRKEGRYQTTRFEYHHKKMKQYKG